LPLIPAAVVYIPGNTNSSKVTSWRRYLKDESSPTWIQKVLSAWWMGEPLGKSTRGIEPEEERLNPVFETVTDCLPVSRSVRPSWKPCPRRRTHFAIAIRGVITSGNTNRTFKWKRTEVLPLSSVIEDSRDTGYYKCSVSLRRSMAHVCGISQHIRISYSNLNMCHWKL
jgi:hypothetical protein